MAITTAVIQESLNEEFRAKVRLNFTTVAFSIVDGTFLNITPTDPEKNTLTEWAYRMLSGRENLNSLVDAILTNATIQQHINGLQSYDSDLEYVAWTRAPGLAGIYPSYGTPAG